MPELHALLKIEIDKPDISDDTTVLFEVAGCSTCIGREITRRMINDKYFADMIVVAVGEYARACAAAIKAEQDKIQNN